MLRRINTLICIGKRRWDQLKHIVDSLDEDLYDPKKMLEKSFIPGRSVGWTETRGERHNLMIVKRCRVLLAWGLAAMFDLLLERYGPDHPYICVLVCWLSKIRKEDLEDRKEDSDFILGDIPIEAISRKIEEILNKREIVDQHKDKLSCDEKSLSEICTQQKEDESTVTDGQWTEIAKKLHEIITSERPAPVQVPADLLEDLKGATGWPCARWKTLLELAHEHFHKEVLGI